ncbi:MAG: energy-coupled thiamine transporter ThiT [Clostridia bacterium]|nr:energy-coupled thiamine transporter ThiT [Clostridia bacterium]
MKRTRTLALVECALMLAAAVALSYVKLFTLPFDGSITLLSMLPICLVAIRHGLAWGLGTAFCYSWFQILQGGVFAWGLTPGMLVASLFLDYILAFTVLGFAGLFRRRGMGGVLLGVALVCLLRFLAHFVSGVVLWANLEEFVAFGREWVGRPWLYSLCYNGVYMLPETVFTVLGAFILFRVPQMRRLLTVKD